MDHRPILTDANLLDRLPKLNRGGDRQVAPHSQPDAATAPSPLREAARPPAAPARGGGVVDRPKTAGIASRAQEPADGILRVDHAVFTSIRTPTGEGYRIIAATPGVSAEERMEITRRSPSHGALTGSGDSAIGLSCYPLPMGRCAIAWSRHAGLEHTARGGERVYTHVAVLSTADYSGYGFNPARIHALLAAAVGDGLILKSPPRLEPLGLPAPLSPASRTSSPAAYGFAKEEVECVLAAANAHLARANLVIAGARRTWDTFAAIIDAMPMFARARLSASIGLSFAPTRQFGLCLVDRDHGDTQRAVAGQPITLIDASKPPPLPAGPYGTWLEHVRSHLSAGRSRDLSRVTERMVEPLSGPALAHVGEVCDDAETVAAASLPVLLALHAKHAARRPDSRLGEELARDLMNQVEQRIAVMQEAEERAKGPG